MVSMVDIHRTTTHVQDMAIVVVVDIDMDMVILVVI